MNLLLQSWDNMHLTFSTPLREGERRTAAPPSVHQRNSKKTLSISSRSRLYYILTKPLTFQKLGIMVTSSGSLSTFLLTYLIISKNVTFMMQCQANLLICLSHKNLHRTSFDMFAINILQEGPEDPSQLFTLFFF